MDGCHAIPPAAAVETGGVPPPPIPNGERIKSRKTSLARTSSLVNEPVRERPGARVSCESEPDLNAEVEGVVGVAFSEWGCEEVEGMAEGAEGTAEEVDG